MTAPAGTISLAQQALKTTLADVTAFRTFADAGDQAAALARIHMEGLPKPGDGRQHTRTELETYRPYAVIFTDDPRGLIKTVDAHSGAFDFAAAGRLKLRIFQDAVDQYDNGPTADANVVFKNHVGEIIDGLCGLAGQGGYLAFERIALDEGPYWGHPKLAPSQGVWQGAEIGIEWRGI